MREEQRRRVSQLTDRALRLVEDLRALAKNVAEVAYGDRLPEAAGEIEAIWEPIFELGDELESLARTERQRTERQKAEVIRLKFH